MNYGIPMTPEFELRRMSATMTWGEHAKGLVAVARGDREPGDAVNGASLRANIEQMRLEDLRDAYAMLLEAVVMDGDLLAKFYVGRTDETSPLRQRLGDSGQPIEPTRIPIDSPFAGLGEGEVFRASVDVHGMVAVRAAGGLPHHEVKRLLLALGSMASDIKPLDSDDA